MINFRLSIKLIFFLEFMYLYLQDNTHNSMSVVIYKVNKDALCSYAWAPTHTDYRKYLIRRDYWCSLHRLPVNSKANNQLIRYLINT